MEKHCFSTAGYYVIPGSGRSVYDFNRDWQFFRGELPEGGFDGVEAAWVNLPHGIDDCIGENASGMRNYQGVVWYRKRFVLPPSMQEKQVRLYFDAAMGRARVYLNGRMQKEHVGGYLPFTVDLSEARYDGSENEIAVWLSNADDGSYPPGKPQGQLDFTYHGGLYRNVYLIETSPLHITDPVESTRVAGGGVYVAVKEMQNGTATVDVRTELANGSKVRRTCRLVTEVETEEGEILLRSEAERTLEPGQTQQILQELTLHAVHAWHPDDPYLHYVRSYVQEGETLHDALRTRFGIRLFAMRGAEGFYINGKPTEHRLNGVNRHQDYVYVGNAMSDAAQYRDAKLLREGGVEIVRAAHYPLSPAFLDACDELGLLVTSANPGWQYFHPDPVFTERIYADTRALVRRDRNRPSVLLWETTLNETDAQPVGLMRHMHEIVHEELPYPGVFTAGDATHARPAGFDVLYHGNEQDRQCLFTREYGDGGEVDNFYSQNAAVRVKREFGEHAQLVQAKIRARDLAAVCYSAPPQRFGSALWCGIDHQRGYHPDPFWGGILDLYRMPRMAYYLFRSQYDPDRQIRGIQTGPMVWIAHELTQISEADVVVFTNCEQVRLTWLGRTYGPAGPEPGYEGMPHPPVVFHGIYDYSEITREYRSRTGELCMVAEGLMDGKTVCREEKRYPERLTGLHVYVDDAGYGLVADGADFVPVRADLIDNKGVRKVLNAEYVHFTVEGEGEIVHESAVGVNPMKTQYGTATVLIRATGRAGEIRVRATSPGLVPDAVCFASVPGPRTVFGASDAGARTRRQKNAATPASRPDMGTAACSVTDGEEKERRIRELQLRLTEKEQEIMELRSRLKG